MKTSLYREVLLHVYVYVGPHVYVSVCTYIIMHVSMFQYPMWMWRIQMCAYIIILGNCLYISM